MERRRLIGRGVRVSCKAAIGAVLFLDAGLATLRAGESPPQLIRVWSHQGQEAENRAMRDIAAAFNDAHAAQNVRVEISFFPDFQYTEKVSIAAAA